MGGDFQILCLSAKSCRHCQVISKERRLRLEWTGPFDIWTVLGIDGSGYVKIYVIPGVNSGRSETEFVCLFSYVLASCINANV